MNETKTNQKVQGEATKLAKQDVNEVVIQGKIIHKYAAEKVTILTISTGRATAIPNYPKVVFFEDLKDTAASYEVGTFVKAVGNIQSSKRNPHIKNQTVLSVFGESIELAETQFELDHGIPGAFAPVINHFKLAGVITAIDIPTRNIVRLTVKCVKNGRTSFVTLSYFSKEPAKVIAEHLPGTFVRASGSVQTSKTEKDGVTKHYQSYVASELK